MDEGSMFEEPDFSRAQSAESDDGYEDDLDGGWFQLLKMPGT
jgi:hypothetical protein